MSKKVSFHFCLILFLCMLTKIGHSQNCPLNSFPYEQSFSASYPLCWTKLYTQTSESPNISNMVYRSASHSLYFSGATGENYSMAIIPIADTIDISRLQIHLFARGSSSSVTAGVLEVGVMSDQYSASSFVNVQTLQLPTHNPWQEFSVRFDRNGEVTGNYIALKWSGANTSLYVDDITIDYVPDCLSVSNFTVTNIMGNSAYLSWDANPEGGVEYIVEYRETGASYWNEYNTFSTNYTLDGLDETTNYEARIKADCGDFESAYSEVIAFRTPCHQAEGDMIGSNPITTDGNTIPIAANRTYTQQIFTAGDLTIGARNITGIAFQFYGTTMSRSNMELYLGHTTTPFFDTITDYIPLASLTKVFSGSVSFNSSLDGNWNHITFDSTFSYNGSDHLVIAVYDNSGDYLNPSAGRFYTHLTEDKQSAYFMVRDAMGSLDPTSPLSDTESGLLNSRNNLQLLYCGEVGCIDINILPVTQITTSSADISWINSNFSSDIDFEYKSLEETEWIVIQDAESSPYTIDFLDPNTEYTVRMRTICNGTDTTDWQQISFRTKCTTINDLPFIENFNDIQPGNDLPFCWNSNSTVVGLSPYIVNLGFTDYHQNNNALHLNNSPVATNIVVLPEFSPELSTLQVAFRAKADALTGTFTIGIMDDPYIPSSFVPVDTITDTIAGRWREFAIPLSSYEGNGQFIAFQWSNGGNNTWLIDDLYINTIPVCSTPDSLEIINISSSTVEITWRETDVATSWFIEYGLSGFTPGSGTSLSTNNLSEEISGLRSNMVYDLYVHAVCAPQSYSFPARISFSTDCGVVNLSDLPYIENFDHYGTGNATYPIPTCWTRTTGNATAPYINTTHFSSPGALYFYVPGSNQVRITTERFDFDVSQLMISFKMRSSLISGELTVGVMTNPDVESTFVPIETFRVNETNVWEDKQLYLSQYTEYGQYIAFRGAGVGAAVQIYMDNLIIDDAGSCPPPSSLSTISVTDSEMAISWVENGTAEEWIVEYGVEGFTLGEGFQETVQNSNTVIENLEPNSLYDIYVKSVCDEGGSPWSRKITVGTAQTPAPIPYFCDFETMEENEKWALVGGDQVNIWHIDTAAAYPDGGLQSLYISNDNGVTNEYTVLGASSSSWAYRDLYFTPSTQDYEIHFNWRNNGEGEITPRDYIIVYIGQPAVVTPGSNTQPAGSITLGNALRRKSDWQSAHYVLPASYSGTTQRIYFNWVNDNASGNQPPGAIDNITIRPYTCVIPTELTAENPDNESVTLNWTVENSPESWEIQYGVAGFLPGTGTSVFTSSNPPYTLSDLDNNTSYHVYVRAVCGEDNHSYWSEKASFSTSCGTISLLPYQESFDSYSPGSATTSVMPSCWTSFTSDAALPYISDEDENFPSSPNGLSFNQTGSEYTLAILPEFSSDIDIYTLLVSFKAKCTPQLQGNFVLGVMTSPQDPLTFTAVDTLEFSMASEWENFALDLYSYFGEGSFIAFQWQASGNSTLLIDDLSVDLNPNPNPDSCATPQNLLVTEILPLSVKVTWTPRSQEQEWELSYKAETDDDFTIITCTSPSYILNTTDSTEYEICVRAICNERDQSAMTCTTFRTPGFSEMSYTIHASAGAHGVITPNGAVAVQYDSEQYFVFIPDSEYVVDSVMVNERYIGSPSEYTFRNIRGDSTIRVNFRLAGRVNDINLIHRVSIFPNPAKEMLTVKTETKFQMCEIMNMVGQLLYTAVVSENEFQVNISSFNAGVYLIRLSGAKGVVTKKIVIE